jgi:hypothetical protein
MTLSEFYTTLAYFVPFDSGFMLQNGLSVYETPFDQVGDYDCTIVPYIIYNEEGTRISTKNKGFISVRTIGALNRNNVDGSTVTGMNERLADRQNEVLVTLGAIDHVAGTDI